MSNQGNKEIQNKIKSEIIPAFNEIKASLENQDYQVNITKGKSYAELSVKLNGNREFFITVNFLDKDNVEFVYREGSQHETLSIKDVSKRNVLIIFDKIFRQYIDNPGRGTYF